MAKILYIGEKLVRLTDRTRHLVKQGHAVDESSGIIGSMEYLKSKKYSTIFFCYGNVNPAAFLGTIRRLQPTAKINVLGVKDELNKIKQEVDSAKANYLLVPITYDQLAGSV